MEEFYALKTEILKGDLSKLSEAEILAQKLSPLSDELQALVSFELRKLKKKVGQ